MKRVLMSLCLGLALASAAMAAPRTAPGVLPINSSAFGHTYGEWAGLWWVWADTTPVAIHPLFENGDVSSNQAQKVWFLGASFTGTDNPMVIDREATIPSGTPLFVPLINWGLEDDPVNHTPENVAYWSGIIEWLGTQVTGLVFQVDGVSVPNLSNYFSLSPSYEYDLPEGNRFDVPAGTRVWGVAGGYHVLLAPLSVGKHTIHFAAISFEGTPDQFSLDVTYHLTVVPAGQYRK